MNVQQTLDDFNRFISAFLLINAQDGSVQVFYDAAEMLAALGDDAIEGYVLALHNNNPYEVYRMTLGGIDKAVWMPIV